MKRKAQIFSFITFIFFAAILLLIASVTVQTGFTLTQKAYNVSETLLKQANDTAQTISLASIRTPVTEDLTNAIQATGTNELIIQQAFQWNWLILLILMLISMYLGLAKTQTQFSRGLI